MYNKISGKIIDPKNNEPIVGADVWLTDEKGEFQKDGSGSPINITKTDINGVYTLPFAFPVPNLATGKVMYVPAGSHIGVRASIEGYPSKAYEIPKPLLDLNATGVGKFDIKPELKTQDIQEVTVVASKAKYDCEKQGGTWDENTKTCTIPKEKTWLQKYKWYLIGGLTVVAVGITVFAIVKRKNARKTKK